MTCPCQNNHREDKIQGGWQQCISVSASAPFTAAPAAWLDSTAPLPCACVEGMSGCVCTGDGSCLPSASLLLWAACWFPFSVSVCTKAALSRLCPAPPSLPALWLTAFLSAFAMAEHGAFFCTDHGCPQLCVLRDIFQLSTERGTKRHTGYFTPVALQTYLRT